MPDILYSIDLLGTLAFAISGVLTAVNKQLDFVGATIFGAITAIGGGTLRDMMIGNTPVGWIQDLNYLFVILLSLPLCYFFLNTIMRWRKGMFIFDTIGIGVFTILGVEKTLAIGLHPIIALIMGVVSAVFGGIIRDVLANEIPLIFRKEIYASACLMGGCLFLGFNFLDLPYNISVLISVASVIAIRYFSVTRKWSIPYRPLLVKRMERRQMDK